MSLFNQMHATPYELRETPSNQTIEKGKVLAIIIEYNDCKKVVVKWLGNISPIIIYDNIDQFKQISLNSNRQLVTIIQ